MTNNPPLSHEDANLLLAEQALGILDGRARAELLAHVDACPECAAVLVELAGTSDALVHLAPGAEPPVGFETRALQRINAASQAPRRHRRRAPALVAAAAAVLVAFGLGWLVSNSTTSGPVRAAKGVVVDQPLLNAGRAVGTAYVYTGSPTWMFVTLSLPSSGPAVRCTIIGSGGKRDLVGTFSLRQGKGAWGTPVPVAFHSIEAIEISTAGGRVLARSGGAEWTYPDSRHSFSHSISTTA